jgi:hypothetical protein
MICARCWKPCTGQPDGGWYAEDMATLVETCRQHEISEHALVVTWEQFCGGYLIYPLPAGPWPLTETTFELPQPERRPYEWLAEELTPAGAIVTVREPRSLAEWDAKYAPYMAEQAAGRAREAESLARGRAALDHQRATWFGEPGCR